MNYYSLFDYFDNHINLNYQVISLELSTGIPMLYIAKEDKYIRRGSPAAPTEAGVYAYTKVNINLSIGLYNVAKLINSSFINELSNRIYVYFLYSLQNLAKYRQKLDEMLH